MRRELSFANAPGPKNIFWSDKLVRESLAARIAGERLVAGRAKQEKRGHGRQHEARNPGTCEQ